MAENKSYPRTRNLFNPKSETPFRLSRSRLENFFNCARCFYLDRRLGIEPPGMPAFTLNSAVDYLLKLEFDDYRRRQEPHPLMKEHGIEAIPFDHPMMDEWREPFKGVQYHHSPTNFIIFGAVDDLWVDKDGCLYVVDYKATSTLEKITLESEYRQAYKRQMEIYQWLLRKQNFRVSDTGYFVYCNGRKDRKNFEKRLDFHIEIIPWTGNADWVEPVIRAARECLMKEDLPEAGEQCGYCAYLKAAGLLQEKSRPHLEIQPELF